MRGLDTGREDMLLGSGGLGGGLGSSSSWGYLGSICFSHFFPMSPGGFVALYYLGLALLYFLTILGFLIGNSY